MWNQPTQNQLAQLPKLGETESVPLKDKVLHMHFFLGGCDWWIAEYDGEDLLWGFAMLNGDRDNAEWGYISFRELKELVAPPGLEVERDLHWRPRKASEIKEVKTYD